MIKLSQAHSTSDPEKPVVFIVDDDVSVRESFEHLVQIAGWKPVVFASAELFLESAPKPGPCCLILDINMPNLDGLELQRLMAAKGMSTPTIFVSGDEDERNTHVIKEGAVAFLTKPINSAELLETLSKALASWEPLS
jgi:FixJ family two-component response regulator